MIARKQNFLFSLDSQVSHSLSRTQPTLNRFQGALVLLGKRKLGWAFSGEGATLSQETVVGWMNTSHCLWPAGEMRARWESAVDLVHHFCEVCAGVLWRGQQVLCCWVKLWSRVRVQ